MPGAPSHSQGFGAGKGAKGSQDWAETPPSWPGQRRVTVRVTSNNNQTRHRETVHVGIRKQEGEKKKREKEGSES